MLAESKNVPGGSMIALGIVAAVRPGNTLSTGTSPKTVVGSISAEVFTLQGQCHALARAPQWRQFLAALRTTGWVVYTQPPCGGADPGTHVFGAICLSRRGLELPARRVRAGAGHVSLEGLCPWEPTTHDDPRCGGVHPPLLVTCSPLWLPAYPSVWVTGQPGPAGQACRVPGAAPGVAGCYPYNVSCP